MFNFLSNAFRNTVSKMKDYKMKAETETSVGYPTGFLSFDFRNGTICHSTMPDGTVGQYYSIGIADGSMVMIIGRSGCGKTTWAIQSAGKIVKPYANSVIYHDDIEGGVLKSRLLNLAGMTPEEASVKYIHRNIGITAENFFTRLKLIHDIKLANRTEFEYDTGIYDEFGNRVYKLQPTVYILDSLSLLMPETYTEEEELSGQMSTTATAKTNAAIFRRIIPILKAANIILYVINHINMKVELSLSQKTKLQVSYLKQNETLPKLNLWAA